MNFLSSISFGEFQWTEIIYAMIGSFVGIFIPLWIDKSRARRQEKDARNKILTSLHRELDSVKMLIEEYNAPDHEYDIFSFSTFVWDSIISSGMLTDILADKNIQGTLLMEIYADLSLLRELHDEFCQNNISTDLQTIEDLRLIYESVMKKRQEIYDKIVGYQTPINNSRK